MSPFMTWFAENLGVILVGGFLIATVALLFGARTTWRIAKRLRTPPRPWVRFLLLLILVVGSAGILVFLGVGLSEIGPGIWAQRGMLGEPAPALDFALVESDLPGSLASFRGQVVLVNVWATWCPPCRAEMADLERLQEAYASDGLVVLHLSDEDRETLLDWIENEPSSTLHAYAQPIPWPETGRPTSYVVDRDGTIQRVLLGQRSYEQFETEIKRVL
jgi:thiol-disulfide isomerase/thioredoxin